MDPPGENVLNTFDKPWNSPTVTIAIHSFAPGVTGPEVNAELEHIWSLGQEGWRYTIKTNVLIRWSTQLT